MVSQLDLVYKCIVGVNGTLLWVDFDDRPALLSIGFCLCLLIFTAGSQQKSFFAQQKSSVLRSKNRRSIFFAGYYIDIDPVHFELSQSMTTYTHNNRQVVVGCITFIG